MKPDNKYTVPFVSLGIAAIGIGLFAWRAMWLGLNFDVQAQTIQNLLGPLILTAAFIERAVEVVISPWRDPGADELARAHDSAMSDPAATAETKSKAARDLDQYKGKTKEYAFAALLAFGLVAAMVGVRALWPLLDDRVKAVFISFSAGQQDTFIVSDVVLSAALMAGGANGIHSVVNAFTTFFDNTAQKAKS